MTSLYNCRELLAGRSGASGARETPRALPAVLVAPMGSFNNELRNGRSAIQEKKKEERERERGEGEVPGSASLRSNRVLIAQDSRSAIVKQSKSASNVDARV